MSTMTTMTSFTGLQWSWVGFVSRTPQVTFSMIRRRLSISTIPRIVHLFDLCAEDLLCCASHQAVVLPFIFVREQLQWWTGQGCCS